MGFDGKDLKKYSTIYKVLAGVGAINWGIVTLFKVNLVDKLAQFQTYAPMVIYIAVGVSGVLLLADTFDML